MPSEKEVKELIESAGGRVESGAVLPDGSAFMTASFPLPKDHWINGDPACENQGFEYPPMVFRMGTTESMRYWLYKLPINGQIITRQQFAEMIHKAGRYAIRASTMKGNEMDFDPDAMLQNLVVGFLGYWTEDGLDHDDAWANPPEKGGNHE